jgi:hypothetical protein
VAAAPVSTQRVASIAAIVPSQKKGYDDITYHGGQNAPSDGGTILNSVVTAAALIDTAESASGHIATDLTTSVELGFRSTAVTLIAAAMRNIGQIATEATAAIERGLMSTATVLLHVLADMPRIVSALDVVAPQVSDDAPAPIALVAEPPAQRDHPATLAAVPVTPGERATAKSPAVRGSQENVDPQHAMVERLNSLSLAAARRAEVWRPTRYSVSH